MWRCCRGVEFRAVFFFFFFIYVVFMISLSVKCFRIRQGKEVEKGIFSSSFIYLEWIVLIGKDQGRGLNDE